MVVRVTLADLKKKCPQWWDEINLDTFQKIYSWEGDYFNLLSILTGSLEGDPNPQKEAAIYELTKWVHEHHGFSLSVPKEFLGVKVPDDLGELSIGKMITARQKVKEKIEQSMSAVCSVLLGVEERLLLEMKAAEVYPVGVYLTEGCLQQWAEAIKVLSQNPKQPKREARQNVAALAEGGRLQAFTDLYLIGDYAERFSMNPDDVYEKTSFRTVINFTCAYKERDEFNERFHDIWESLNEK